MPCLVTTERLLLPLVTAVSRTTTPMIVLTALRSVEAVLHGQTAAPHIVATLQHVLRATLRTMGHTSAGVVHQEHAVQGQLRGRSTAPTSRTAIVRPVSGLLSGASQTTETAGVVARMLRPGLRASSTTRPAVVSMPGLRALVARLGAASRVSSPLSMQQRAYVSTLEGLTTIPPGAITLLRTLRASVAGESLTPDVVLTNVLRIESHLVGPSLTAASDFALLRVLMAQVTTGTQTLPASLVTERLFVSSLAGTSHSTDVLGLPHSGMMSCQAHLIGDSQTAAANIALLPKNRVGYVRPRPRMGHVRPRSRVGHVAPVRRTTRVS